MPNICFNNCKIECDKTTIQSLHTNVSSNQSLLQVLCGLHVAPEHPHEVFGTRSECFNLHIVDFHIGEHNAHIEFEFETAWEPPLLAYTAFVTRHASSTVRATYDEWGNSVHGQWVGCDGGDNIRHTSGKEEYDSLECEEEIDDESCENSDGSSDIGL